MRKLGLINLNDHKYELDISTVLLWCRMHYAMMEYNRIVKEAEKHRKKLEKDFKKKYPQKKKEMKLELVPKAIMNNFPEIWKEMDKYAKAEDYG